MPRVAVVVPSMNGLALLRDVCLPSLARQSYRDFRVVVVDNGSTDGTCEYLAAKWPAVAVLPFSDNRGFAEAVNRGIAQVSSELVALVNNDVELDARWLEELVAGIDSYQSAGSVAGKVLSYKNRTTIQSVGEVMTRDGMFYSRGSGEIDAGQFDAPEAIFSATAGAALFRRAAFEQVGLFDEAFFAYVEDADWGFRAQLAGLECWYIPTAKAFHIGQATSTTMTGLAAYLVVRNAIWLVVKNFPASVMVKNSPRILLATTLRSYRTTRRTSMSPVIRAWIDAVSGLPEMMRRRKAIQSKRTVTSASLEGLFSRPDLGSAKLSRLSHRIKTIRRNTRHTVRT